MRFKDLLPQGHTQVTRDKITSGAAILSSHGLLELTKRELEADELMELAPSKTLTFRVIKFPSEYGGCTLRAKEWDMIRDLNEGRAIKITDKNNNPWRFLHTMDGYAVVQSLGNPAVGGAIPWEDFIKTFSNRLP
jgi:hypothetical protein